MLLSVSVRALLVLVLVAMLVVSEAAPQFGRGRPGRRFGRPNRRFSRPNRFNNRFNQIGNFVRPFLGGGGGGGGQSNTQANANVIQGQQGNNQATLVSANVLNQNQNRPGTVSLSGGVALASNLQLNSPFGNINLSNAQAQTVNQAQNIGGFFRG